MMIDLVKYPILTEKSVRLMDSNHYTFDTDSRLTKIQIKEVMKEAFNVSVVAVNTHRPPRKKRRVGARQGYKSAYKRVIITLKAGESIQLLPGSESITEA